jgi:hypothetical protein
MLDRPGKIVDVLNRACAKCHQPRPIRDFEGEDQPCLSCRARGSRSERAAKIIELERQRRSLIATLVKIDAEIAELRGRPPAATASAPFARVESSDVFEGETSDPGDIGLGD